VEIFALAQNTSEYRIEMVLLLYSIVIGFSFNIFRKDSLILFQYLAGIAAILYLAGRMFSLWNQFSHQPTTYNEVLFFIDILIMIAFYRSLAKISNVNDEKVAKFETYQEIWLLFAISMFFTAGYRIIYAGLSWHNLTQSLAILYCLAGILAMKLCRKKGVTIAAIDQFQLVYATLFFFGAIGYCIMRFRILDF
jgi:hypothetical protein